MADKKPPPPPPSQLKPERFAERTLVLLDGAEGLLARCHRLDRTLRLDEKRCRAVREPEWKGLRSKLSKAFPALPDLTSGKIGLVTSPSFSVKEELLWRLGEARRGEGPLHSCGVSGQRAA